MSATFRPEAVTEDEIAVMRRIADNQQDTYYGETITPSQVDGLLNRSLVRVRAKGGASYGKLTVTAFGNQFLRILEEAQFYEAAY